MIKHTKLEREGQEFRDELTRTTRPTSASSDLPEPFALSLSDGLVSPCTCGAIAPSVSALADGWTRPPPLPPSSGSSAYTIVIHYVSLCHSMRGVGSALAIRPNRCLTNRQAGLAPAAFRVAVGRLFERSRGGSDAGRFAGWQPPGRAGLHGNLGLVVRRRRRCRVRESSFHHLGTGLRR